MPKPPLLGEVASSEAKMSERLYRAAPAFSAQSKGVLCPTSQTPAVPAPLAGEPLAKRFRFAVTHGVAIKLHRRKASPYQGRWHAAGVTERFGPHRLPKPLLPGEVASSEAKMSERLHRAAPALFRSLERRPLSNLSDACGASSPGRGALGKEVSFSMKLICVCWKTSRNAKASPTRGGGTAKP